MIATHAHILLQAHGGNDTLGCAAAVEDAVRENARGPALYTNNDGWPNATDGGTMIGRHNISLAAYLLAAEEGSYFASGLHWTDLIPGTQKRAWPYWSDFSARLGPPSGKRKRQPGTFIFERGFQFATVQLDCGSMSAKIDWLATEKTKSSTLLLKSDDASGPSTSKLMECRPAARTSA